MTDQRSSNANYAWKPERPGDFADMTSRPRRAYGERNDNADPLRNRYVGGPTNPNSRETEDTRYHSRMPGEKPRKSDDVTFEDLLWSGE